MAIFWPKGPTHNTPDGSDLSLWASSAPYQPQTISGHFTGTASAKIRQIKNKLRISHFPGRQKEGNSGAALPPRVRKRPSSRESHRNGQHKTIVLPLHTPLAHLRLRFARSLANTPINPRGMRTLSNAIKKRPPATFCTGSHRSYPSGATSARLFAAPDHPHTARTRSRKTPGTLPPTSASRSRSARLLAEPLKKGSAPFRSPPRRLPTTLTASDRGCRGYALARIPAPQPSAKLPLRA